MRARRRRPAAASPRFSSTSGTTSAIVGEPDEIEILDELLAADECLCELVDDAGAAQLGERVLRRTRHDERAFGQPVARTMVIGDHDLQAEGSRLGDLLDRRDPAIDRHNEATALVRKARERLAG